jgi:hypothetical protein
MIVVQDFKASWVASHFEFLTEFQKRSHMIRLWMKSGSRSVALDKSKE